MTTPLKKNKDQIPIPRPPVQSEHTEPIEPIYVMTIELAEGKNDHIKIYPSSNPDELSYDFCHKNNLDFQSLNFLKEQIKELISDYVAKNSQQSSFYNEKEEINGKPKNTTFNQKQKKPSEPKNTPNKNNSSDKLYNSFLKNQQEKKNNQSIKEYQNNSTFIHKMKNRRKTSENALRNCNNYTYVSPVLNEVYKKVIAHPPINPRSSKSKDKSNIRIKKNYGEILYERGLADEKRKQRKLRDLKEKLYLKTEENYTFKPQIYSSSPSIIQSGYNKNFHQYKSCKTESGLQTKSSRNRTANSHKSKKEKDREQSFSPNPSNRSFGSRKLQTKNSISNFHKTFQTNGQSLKIPFTARQVEFKKKKEEKMERLRDELHPPKDIKTGQCLFRPRINAKDKKNGIKYSNIFANLYSYAEKYKLNHNIKTEKVINEIENLSKQRASANSEEIFKKKKRDTFSYVFRLMDTDEDGLISIYNIDFKKVDEEILDILKPLINDLKEYQGSIKEEEFINECDKIFEKLPFQKRKKFLNFKKQNNKEK